MIAQTIADVLGVNVIDDGTISTIEANFISLFHTLTRIYGIDTGTTNNVVVTLPTNQTPINLTSIIGVPVNIKIGNTNTTSVTFNISGLGATPVINPDGTPLIAGQIIKNGLATFVYDGIYFELITTITGPLTGKINVWTLGQTWQSNGTFNASVLATGSMTGSSLVSTGGASAAAGVTATGADSGAASFRFIGGSYGAMLRNDGVSAILTQTSSGNQYGLPNSFLPFYWTLATGAVTIDGGGLGARTGGALAVAGALTTSSTLTATGSITGPSVTATNFDTSGAGQFRANYGNYGVIFRNDGSYFYMMQTAAGTPTGIYNGFRPFYWALSSGAVTLDGTGAGVNTGGALIVAGAFSAGGAVTSGSVINSNGNITANNGRMRALLGVSLTDVNSVPILNDWVNSFSVNGTGNIVGYTKQPDGLIEQTQVVLVPVNGGNYTTTNVTLPVAYTRTHLDATICFVGTVPPPAGGIAVSPISLSQAGVTTISANSGVGAWGVMIKSRGY